MGSLGYIGLLLASRASMGCIDRLWGSYDGNYPPEDVLDLGFTTTPKP